MITLAAPAPTSFTGLVIKSGVVHVAEPADTLIVSPVEALDTQLLTLVSSGVELHVGLLPVHCARRNIGKSNRASTPKSVLISDVLPFQTLPITRGANRATFQKPYCYPIGLVAATLDIILSRFVQARFFQSGHWNPLHA